MMLRIDLCLAMACLFSSVGLVGCKFRSAGAMSTPKAIFGKDDRKEWFELGNPLQLLASATVAMIDRSNLIETPDGYAISPKVKDYRTWAGLCPKVRFAEQPTAADCTGFLVGPDLMVTAGHCVSDQYPCNSYAFVLDYKLTAKDTVTTRFSRDQVRFCAAVVAKSVDPDWAVVRLDRPATDRSYFHVRKSGDPALGTELAILGYPHGLPVKVAGNSFVRENQNSDVASYFEADLDGFGGNSGSPVINLKTSEVEGIFVSGFGEFDDGKADDGTPCKVPRVFENLDEGTPGHVTRSSTFRMAVP